MREDSGRCVVSTSDIKYFPPRNNRDFDPSLPVKALLRGLRNAIPRKTAERYSAFIFKLGGEYFAVYGN